MNADLRNKQNPLTVRDIAQIGVFTALTAIGAFITIPAVPVPITLQTFFALMSGMLLGSRKAMLSQIAYVLLGLAGLPILAGFSGGLQTVMKPSFGFLIGFIPAAYLTGKIAEGSWTTVRGLTMAALAGTLCMYVFGLPYMYYILNIVLSKNMSLYSVLKAGMLLFIPGDTIKAAVAIYLAKKLKNRIRI